MKVPAVALVGFMGAGKSTVGPSLADRLGVPFLDLDAELESLYGPISSQLTSEGGLAAFRARERELIGSKAGVGPHVLATGGGAWADEGARATLAASHRVVFLDAPLGWLALRVAGSRRPLWDASVAERYSERLPLYRLAHARVAADQPVEAIVDAIVAVLA